MMEEKYNVTEAGTAGTTTTAETGGFSGGHVAAAAVGGAAIGGGVGYVVSRRRHKAALEALEGRLAALEAQPQPAQPAAEKPAE